MNCPYCGFEKEGRDRCPNCGLSHAAATEQASWKEEKQDMKEVKAPVEEIKTQLVGKPKLAAYGGDPKKAPKK